MRSSFPPSLLWNIFDELICIVPLCCALALFSRLMSTINQFTPLTLERMAFFSFFAAARFRRAPEATAAAAAALSGTRTERSLHTRSTGRVTLTSELIESSCSPFAESARRAGEEAEEEEEEEGATDGETDESLSSAEASSRCSLLRLRAAPARARTPWTAAAPAAIVSWCCGAAMTAAPCFL